jgi:hypothetical protein
MPDTKLMALIGHSAYGSEIDQPSLCPRCIAIEWHISQHAGMVFLVGAGPGAADLLTLRAQRLVGEADVIVHDRQVSDEVLDMARRDAERIFVGKARANHCMRQADINAWSAWPAPASAWCASRAAIR